MSTGRLKSTHIGAPGGWSGTAAAVAQDVFQGFPYGLIVTEADGRIVCSNVQAQRLIDDKPVPVEHPTCCALLGCGVPDGLLASGCMTEMALAHGALLPEIRLDLDVSSGPAALWVAAAPLADADGLARYVVMQLRPGVAKDRRRRTDPHWMTGPRLRVRALGRMVVETAEGTIDGEWLDQRTGQLLKYLIAERHRAVHVEEIGENVWPSADFAIAASVRYYIHALRGKIEPRRPKRGPSAFIVSSAGGYRLDLERVSIDADEFERAISEGLAAIATDTSGAEAELEKGLALYRGDFLADFPYAEWAMPERHRLHDMACRALRELTELRLKRRMLDQASRSLERLAAMQPYDEAVHKQLMELDVARGHRSDAIRRYSVLRNRMRRTFGNDPSFSPADLGRLRY